MGLSVGKPGLCKKHGGQHFVTVSKRLKLAIDQDTCLAKDDLYTVEIISGDAKSKNIYIMDAKIFSGLGLKITNKKVSLRDRDESTKNLYDRLVIRQLFDKQRGNWVCSECLRELANKVNL